MSPIIVAWASVSEREVVVVQALTVIFIKQIGGIFTGTTQESEAGVPLWEKGAEVRKGGYIVVRILKSYFTTHCMNVVSSWLVKCIFWVYTLCIITKMICLIHPIKRVKNEKEQGKREPPFRWGTLWAVKSLDFFPMAYAKQCWMRNSTRRMKGTRICQKDQVQASTIIIWPPMRMWIHSIHKAQYSILVIIRAIRSYISIHYTHSMVGRHTWKAFKSFVKIFNCSGVDIAYICH